MKWKLTSNLAIRAWPHNTLGKKKSKYSWQFFTVSILLVYNIQVTVNTSKLRQININKHEIVSLLNYTLTQQNNVIMLLALSKRCCDNWNIHIRCLQDIKNSLQLTSGITYVEGDSLSLLLLEPLLT